MKSNFENEMLNKIKNILIKKSEGFFYNEEVLEYQLNNTNQESKINQLTFLEDKNHESEQNKNNQNLTLVKKKVTTHYVSPDLLALKMLIEIFGEKVSDDDLSSLSDEELLNLKNDILKKLEEV